MGGGGGGGGLAGDFKFCWAALAINMGNCFTARSLLGFSFLYLSGRGGG